MMKRSTYLCGITLVALSLMVTSCNQNGQNGGGAAKEYKTLTVGLGSSDIDARYSASIRGEQFVDIRPQVSGVITQILVKEGANITKGQTLFVIDQVPYKAALDVAVANVKSAEASVATAKLNADNARELHKESVISSNELQITLNTLASAEANLALMKAQEQSARNDLSYTVIKSPVDGVASMIPYRVGALVSSSITDPLMSVSNNKNMYAYFSMSESQLLALTRVSGSADNLTQSMDKVELILRDGEKYDQLGEIDAISGTIDRTTGTVSMRAMFANPDQMLRDGGSGSVVITTQMENVIVVPKIATFEIQNIVFAYKVVDGKAVSSQLGVYPYNNGKEYVVESGLELGDIIIAEGAGLLREGTPVAIEGTKSETKE
ncbi:MAG: efflux RND transporter periplasmic adaptor subunit [Rikenellaceae bacterium]